MSDDVCWLDIIDEDEADGLLKTAYDTLRAKDGRTQNLYRAFSRYPNAILSADQAYRDVLHAPGAPLPMWLSELVGVQVAVLAGCGYALANHGDNLVRLHDDRETGRRMLDALKAGDWGNAVFDSKLRAILVFGEKLAQTPDAMSRDDIQALRQAGLSDEEISQTVQVAANFAYWVRVINAFGIQLGDGRIGKYS